MEKGRAYRRAQVVRLKAKRRSYHGGANSDRELGRWVWTAAVCSCWMCGNPRRYFRERTIQERRFCQRARMKGLS
ncbi:hypothetical protein C7418_1263 [Cupriavidus plantarum]|nr:hypothetical protein C7418_1263 [Cupriavidus plantarum]